MVFQANFKDLDIEEMYQDYCLSMRRSLVVILIFVVLATCTAVTILHLAESKVICAYYSPANKVYRSHFVSSEESLCQ